MTSVILDTNALFYPFQFRVELEEELKILLGRCEFFVPEIVISEVKNLAKKGTQFAAAALKYAERFEILPDSSGLQGDDGVLEAARKADGLVVTSDRELISRAKDAGLQVVFLRGKNRLELK